VHVGAVGVEDPRNLDLQCMLPIVVEHQRLGAALAFVIAATQPDRIHVAPIVLFLGMFRRIAVNLRRRRLQDARLHALRKAEHIDGAVHTRLGRLHRIELIVHRACRTGEIVNLIDLDIERKRHVVPHQLEVLRTEQAGDVALAAGIEIIDAQHVVFLAHEPRAQMRAQKPGAAGD
jgi:hypothetical protein